MNVIERAGQVGADSQIRFFAEVVEGDFDLWWQHTAPLYDVRPIASPHSSGRFKFNGYVHENGVFADVKYDGQALRLGRQHADQFGNLVFVQRFVSGGAIGRAGDVAFDHRPGDVSIVDHARPCEGLHQVSQVQGVHLTKSFLGLDPSAPIPRRDFPAGTVMARLLNAELDQMFHPLKQGQSGVAAAKFYRFVSCVKLAILGAPATGDVRRQARGALRDVICQFIERNLASPDLSTATLLREFGVSRASLYRMFEPENGVRNYISNRRLFRAVFELSVSPTRRGHVHEVAERWGYSSDANFSRSVRRMYGTSPGALFRGTSRAVVDAGSESVAGMPVKMSYGSDWLASAMQFAA